MKDKITKGDIALILCTISLTVFLFLFPFISSGENLVATVYLEGEIVFEKSLSSLTESETVCVGGCEILLERDGATFIHSECVDSLCIKRGKLKLKGDSMACVPERVALVIKATDEKFDGISY